MTIASLRDLIAAGDEAEIAGLTGQTTVQLEADLATVAPVTAAAELAYADSVVFSFIGDRLLDVQPPYPRLLITVAADLARARLYKTLAPDHIIKLRDDAMRALRDCRDGKQTLGLTAAGDKPQAQQSAVAAKTSDKLFGREKLALY